MADSAEKDPTELLGSRQLKAQTTRRRIFAAASELFAAAGYHETTVDQIARKAGVAKGTFFVHFATKEAVVAQLVEAQTRAARRARARALADGLGPVAALRAAIMTLGEQAGESRELSRAVLAATLANTQVGGAADALFSEVLAELTVDARAAQKAGLLVPRPSASVIADTLMASYLGAVLHFTTSVSAQPILKTLGALVDVNLQGLLVRKVTHEDRSRAARIVARPRRRGPGV
jgi:TetR/AcrR family transcriptional regulator, fatty acid metabolism regulator protein